MVTTVKGSILSAVLERSLFLKAPRLCNLHMKGEKTSSEDSSSGCTRSARLAILSSASSTSSSVYSLIKSSGCLATKLSDHSKVASEVGSWGE